MLAHLHVCLAHRHLLIILGPDGDTAGRTGMQPGYLIPDCNCATPTTTHAWANNSSDRLT